MGSSRERFEMKRHFILLDRDGVINRDSVGYIRTPDEWEPLPGSLEALKKLTEAGYEIYIITNQSGIGRGYYSLQDMRAIHRKMNQVVCDAGGVIRGIYYCPHAPERKCGCRKPASGLFLQCAKEHRLDLTQGWFVGDKISDLLGGAAVGMRSALVKTGHGNQALLSLPRHHEYPVFDDLYAFCCDLLS